MKTYISFGVLIIITLVSFTPKTNHNLSPCDTSDNTTENRLYTEMSQITTVEMQRINKLPLIPSDDVLFGRMVDVETSENIINVDALGDATTTIGVPGIESGQANTKYKLRRYIMVFGERIVNTLNRNTETALVGLQLLYENIAVSYTHLTLPTTPYV